MISMPNAEQNKPLPYEIRFFIVTQVARRRTPTEVARAVRENFGLKISKQRIEKYDPTKASGRELSKKWVSHFYTTRVRYDDELASSATGRI
jgi:hypothetical protein